MLSTYFDDRMPLDRGPEGLDSTAFTGGQACTPGPEQGFDNCLELGIFCQIYRRLAKWAAVLTNCEIDQAFSDQCS